MGKPEPQQVGVREFRGNLTSYLRQARGGASFLVMSHNEVLAEIRPPSSPEPPQRRVGMLRGKIKISADFDVTPTDILDAMEQDEA